MNKADNTGVQPVFNTGLVYLLRKTQNIQNGNRTRYTATIINVTQ